MKIFQTNNQLKNYTKQIIKKKLIKKVYSPFIDNIPGKDIADMLLTSKFNNGFRFLFCVIDTVIALKDKKELITNAFQKILQEANHKRYKISIDKGSELYNRLMKSFMQNNAIETYSTHNEGKSVAAERFFITLKKL